MRLHKILYSLLICVLCIGFTCNMCHADEDILTANFPVEEIQPSETNENVEEERNWINADNIKQFNKSVSTDATKFQEQYQQNIKSNTFVPIEVRLGLVFMKALSAIDYVLQISLVRFTIMFLLVMYAFWVGLSAYKMIRESTDYKKVLYDVVFNGLKIAAWIIILNYGPAKIFTMIMTPIIGIGTYLSDFILDTVAQTYNVEIPNTCETIRDYVNANNTGKLLIDADSAANIMCLPGRVSMYFYHAIGAAFDWIKYGFLHSLTAIIVGIISIFIFIKCIFKYAFMTLGVVADLFLTLMMLPFTALAESTPKIEEKNYAGQIFTGLLSVFNTKKVSDIITIFINATIYFASLAIIIAICAALLTNIIAVDANGEYFVSSAMTTILAGCLVLYLADKSDSLATQVGGKIDNSFGETLNKDAKQVWSGLKSFGTKLVKAWAKK